MRNPGLLASLLFHSEWFMSIAEWMLKNGSQISLVGLLTFEFVIGCLALYKKWIVLGWVHKSCEERLQKFEDAATAAAEKANQRLELLESLLDDDRVKRRRI